MRLKPLLRKTWLVIVAGRHAGDVGFAQRSPGEAGPADKALVPQGEVPVEVVGLDVLTVGFFEPPVDVLPVTTIGYRKKLVDANRDNNAPTVRAPLLRRRAMAVTRGHKIRALHNS